MDWIGFFTTLLARVPIEKILFAPPDRSKNVEGFLTSVGSPVVAKEMPSEQKLSTSIPVAKVQESEETPPPSLPTREETTAELRRRLARELYKAELDLAGGLKIAGRPCTCLESKHTLMLEASAEELIPEEPSNPVYAEIIQWIKDNQPKITVEAIASGEYASEYPKMASQFRGFRKRVMGTAAISDLVKPGQKIGLMQIPGEGLTLDEAKKLAAEEAAREVEKKWHSQEKK